ncbi:MAG: CBS domain-containing protein [Acidimicrobiales bacterium]
MFVRDLMATDVVTTTPDATLAEVDHLFAVHAISGAPVLDGAQLVGVVSQSDVMRVLYDVQHSTTEVPQYLLTPIPIPLPALEEIAHNRQKVSDRLIDLTVADAMTVVPVTVSPDDPIEIAAQMMVDERIHRVLVTDSGHLVGILSALDLVGVVAQTVFGEMIG